MRAILQEESSRPQFGKSSQQHRERAPLTREPTQGEMQIASVEEIFVDVGNDMHEYSPEYLRAIITSSLELD